MHLRAKILTALLALVGLLGLGLATAAPAQAWGGHASIYNGGNGVIGVAHYTNQYGYDALLWPGQFTDRTFGWSNTWGYWVGYGSCVDEYKISNDPLMYPKGWISQRTTYGWHYADNGWDYHLFTASCGSW